MRFRRSVAVIGSAVAVIAGSGIVASATSSASPPPTTYPQAWCAYPKAPPCVVSVSQDGAAILSSDPTWVASIGNDYLTSGDTGVQWSISSQTAGVKENGNTYASMGPDQTTHRWSITLKLDSNPRSISGYADQLQTSVTDNNNGTWDVTFTGYPVTTGVNDECQPVTPVNCPSPAKQDVTLFQGQADDFQYTSIPSTQWADYNGLREWTNVEESDLPPQVSGDPLTITEQLANSHELSTGTVFEGFFHAILPNPFLVDMGIDDPSTIDPGSISTSIGSGTVAVVPGSSSTEIDITGITFSPRTLKIKRGTITPTRPTITRARRTAAHRASLTFTKSRARGSHLRGYQARCVAPNQTARTAFVKQSPVAVTGLSVGVAYTCRVRAKSKAGYGSWSKSHVVAR